MPENLVISPEGETGVLTADRGVDFFHCLEAMGFISQCKVGKPCMSLGKTSSFICVPDRYFEVWLSSGDYSPLTASLASYCINESYTCTMGEIWILVELLTNIPLTKQET